MKHLYFILTVLISLTTLGQSYELGLVHNSGYNFKIVAIPDFTSSGDTDISDVGFTLMLPAGVADTTNPVTSLAVRTWNISQFDVSFLTSLLPNQLV